jgi:hypothetical protein
MDYTVEYDKLVETEILEFIDSININELEKQNIERLNSETECL